MDALNIDMNFRTTPEKNSRQNNDHARALQKDRPNRFDPTRETDYPQIVRVRGLPVAAQYLSWGSAIPGKMGTW